MTTKLPNQIRKSSMKALMKEKVVLFYEAFFKGQDVAIMNKNFWEEFFLLKVNPQALTIEIEKQSIEQLRINKDIIGNLFNECIKRFNTENEIRTTNAIQTVNCLLRGIASKVNDVTNILTTIIHFDEIDELMETMVFSLVNILENCKADIIHKLTLKLIITIVTIIDTNIDQNLLIEYLMKQPFFEIISKHLGKTEWRLKHGHDALILLTLLGQYRKYNSTNPYTAQLSVLNEDFKLNGYAQTISRALTEFNNIFKKKCLENESSGFLSTLSNIVGNVFVSDDRKISIGSTNDALLLALYEACHLNRNFLMTLMQTHTAPSPVQTPPESPKNSLTRSTSMPVTSKQSDAIPNERLPTNLLINFLEFTSIIMQEIKEESRFQSCKLCLLIFTCITEDQFANQLMHDPNMNFRVSLHRIPMRHRKISLNTSSPSRTIAAALLDLLVEFIHSHMMKNFPMELYMKSFGIIIRILNHQKRNALRLKYNWKDLWTALISLIKFVIANENYLLKQKHDLFALCYQVVNIFNIFITHGDTFLPSANTYDELYYEIIRTHQSFNSLFNLCQRYSISNNDHVVSAKKLSNAIVNVKSIVNHFSPKLDAWQTQNKISTLTEEQVLEIVKENYDTLTLKLHESLDQYTHYNEQKQESAFFKKLIRKISGDVNKQACPIKLDCYEQFNIDSLSNEH